MAKITFFSVLKSNLGCAICTVKNCEARYYPERRKIDIHGGIRQISCIKQRKKN